MNTSSRRFCVCVLLILLLGSLTANGQENGQLTKEVGKVYRNSISMELTYIPGAKPYMMGSAAGEALRDKDEGPQRKVTIGKEFWMGKYEVTQAEYEKVMGTNPSLFRDCARCPVEAVSWEDAREFLKKLNAVSERFVYRLPTEAEWEYAARAGSGSAFSSGDSLSANQANFDSRYPYGEGSKGEYKVRPVDVGSFKPNAWSLYDMHGNVWEWVEDFYVKKGYDGLPVDGSANISIGDQYKRVRRGGGWASWGKALRSANRGWKNPRDRSKDGGFRVVATPK
jgi:formylglycine-generating enzyme required for sulfatase activity